MFNPFKNDSTSNSQLPSGITGNDLTMMPGGAVFDENKIDFKLNGGPKYTDVLVASAMFNDGSSKGYACPLMCKWFYTIKGNELHEIEGVSGSFYQPSLDDIGSKIWVHAHPTNGIDEYQGMPMFAEVGPLVMDDEVLKITQAYIKKSESDRSFRVRIINSNIKNLTDKNLPFNWILQASDMMVVFKTSNDNMQFFMIPFSKKFPKLKIIRNANNLIEIKVNDDHEYLVIEIEPSLRDVLTLVIRSLLSKGPIEMFKDEIKFSSPGHQRNKTQSYVDPVLDNQNSEESKEKVNKSADACKYNELIAYHYLSPSI
jgi:hypothetical protein